MTSLTIRNLDEDSQRRLCMRAAENGHSMEQEARAILHTALDEAVVPTKKLGTAIHDVQAVQWRGA